MATLTELWADNATTTLAGSITNVATTANLAAGTGALFPAPGATQFFRGTFTHANGSPGTEIVYVTAVATDTITMLRGQEGTTAQAWASGDFFFNSVTAGALTNLTQPKTLQQQPGNSGPDTGTANNGVVALAVVPDSLAALAGTTLRVKKSSAANTGSYTLAVNGFTATTVKHGDGTNLASGELPANGYFTVTYDAAAGQFTLQSAGAAGSVSAAQLQTQPGNYGTDTGSANALTVTLAPVPASLASMVGTAFRVLKTASSNTGAATLTLNGFTTTPIVWGDGSALLAGDLPGSCLFTLAYDGSDFVLQSPTSSEVSQSDLQQQTTNSAADSGSANAVVVTLAPVPASLASILRAPVRIKKVGAANTGAVTINANGLGAVALVHGDGSALLLGELSANSEFEVMYNGTNFTLLSFLGPAQLDALLANSLFSTTGPQSFTLGSTVGTFTNTTGRQPNFDAMYLTCVTSDATFSPGDVVVPSRYNGTSGFQIQASPSTVTVVCGSGAISVAGPSGGANMITPSKWTVTVNVAS